MSDAYGVVFARQDALSAVVQLAVDVAETEDHKEEIGSAPGGCRRVSDLAQ
ncbi:MULTISPECIES: hypothetical protein [unclassified Nocardia]|uniref:hypothetical protein n=1 Tax=unclassified Nocardia TaxID=2637762 RepID=UPI0024A953CE|nr:MULTISPECIES: hypothetical protein [unclassified Nocardia]